jgi:tetratricopeptide (TPR) repeat protein
LVSFLIILLFALVCSQPSSAAEKKTKRPPEVHQGPVSGPVAVNDVNIDEYFKLGEDQLKKGRQDNALRIFQGIYDYSRDTLALLKVAKSGYDKALAGSNIDQNQKEELYLKLQRIASLSTRYTELKGESAYRIGLVYRAKGNNEQARKYLLETCQTAPFSLDPTSTWMKAKDMLLSLSHLEGEF